MYKNKKKTMIHPLFALRQKAKPMRFQRTKNPKQKGRDSVKTILKKRKKTVSHFIKRLL